MAGSTSETVHDIFESMEYGPTSSSAAAAQAWLARHSQALGLFIQGKMVGPADRETRCVIDSKGSTVCSTVVSSGEDVTQCVVSSLAGFQSWSTLSCHQRATLLLRWGSVVSQHGQCVSELSQLSQCAPFPPAALVRLAQYHASWARLRDSQLPGWSPLGVVVVLSDDASLQSLMHKVLPALAMGNAVVMVPGLGAAPPALILAQLSVEAGLPAGALNVLTGPPVEVGVALAQDPGVARLCYAGSSQEGVALGRATAGLGVPLSLSPQGGVASPFIVFESADLDSAVEAVLEAAFCPASQGDWLLCVQESVEASLVLRLQGRMGGLRSVSLPSEAHRLQAEAVVQQALASGATLIQPCAPPSLGAQYPPTVLRGLGPSSLCVVAPPPGHTHLPLLPLLTFRSTAEGVSLGNHSPQGLSASVWTEDLSLALEAGRSLQVGLVCVNSLPVSDPSLPVTGHKHSSSCTDGGQQGLYQYLRASSSSPLPRCSSSLMDYSQFGTTAPPVVIPLGTEPSSVPKTYLQLVGGKLCKSESGRSVAVQPPEGSGVLAYCPEGGRKDVRDAVEAAVRAQPGWEKRPASARARCLLSLARALEGRGRDMAASLSAQTSLPLDQADKEVELSVSRLCDWSARCDLPQGALLPLPQPGSALSMPEALGVVGLVLPDDQPLLSMVTLLGAAVAMGNAVVMVPGERHPVPALAFAQVVQASELPAGLVSIVSGGRDQLTAALANHNVLRAIWYWGSAEGCQYLQHSCLSPLKTLWLHSQQGKGEGWSDPPPSLLEEVWSNAVQWKSVWIPTA